MEPPSNLAHARLTEIAWDENQNAPVVLGGVSLEVQFNPESLKLSYSNQKAGNNQSGGAPTQYVGEGTTKLNFDLWFDVDAPAPNRVGVSTPNGPVAPAAGVTDVRRLTEQVIYFIRAK